MSDSADSVLCKADETNLDIYGSNASSGNRTIPNESASVERNAAGVHKQGRRVPFRTGSDQRRFGADADA